LWQGELGPSGALKNRRPNVTLRPFEPRQAPALAEAYNHAVRDLPHCYPVRASDVQAMIEAEANGQGLRQALVGWVHAGLGVEGRRDGAHVGVIRFLWYARGRRQAGQALLEAAEAHLRAQAMARIVAYPQRYRYPFYHLHNAYLSDRLEHVLGLFGWNAYRPEGGEVFFDWRDLARHIAPQEPARPDLPVRIRVTELPGRGLRPGVLVSAQLGDDPAGECVCVSAAECAPAEHVSEASEWGFVDGLGVPEHLQARGLGRYLLGRALWELGRLGYRHASISTAWDNYRALLFYSNFGFRAVDWTYGLAREWT
jgi:ribosomal protein S18 acetylase RimI-like enzyme